MKVRIIERTHVNGHISYVIQQKHFIFNWVWVDAWVNSSMSAACVDSFNSKKQALDNLCYFDGSKISDKVIHKGK